MNQVSRVAFMDIHVDKTLDIKGVYSPRPAELTLNILRSMAAGQILQVITNERTTRSSIPDLCSENGFVLLDTREEGGTLYFTIRV